MFDGHLDDFGLFDSTPAFFHILGWYEPRKVGEAVVHPITSTFLNDSVRHRILRTSNVKRVLITRGVRKATITRGGCDGFEKL